MAYTSKWNNIDILNDCILNWNISWKICVFQLISYSTPGVREQDQESTQKSDLEGTHMCIIAVVVASESNRKIVVCFSVKKGTQWNHAIYN